jgi:hypothetical protein
LRADEPTVQKRAISTQNRCKLEAASLSGLAAFFQGRQSGGLRKAVGNDISVSPKKDFSNQFNLEQVSKQ